LIKSDKKVKNNHIWVMNIRKSECDYVIVGEPFFQKYYTYFDFQKDEIGIALRRKSIE
jgi:hypothetical protein